MNRIIALRRMLHLAGRGRMLPLLVVLLIAISHVSPGLPSAAAAEQGTSIASNDSSSQQQAPTRAIFSDDFEAYGDSTLWNASTPFPVQSDVVANGLFAARMTNMGGNPVYGRTSLDQSYRRLFVRIRFQVDQVGGTPTTLLNLRSTQTTSVIAVRIDAAGTISYVTGASGITSSSVVTAAAGEWHELQVMVDTAQQTDNVRIWLDSAELTSMRQNAWLGDEGMRIVDLGDNSAQQITDIAFDDVIVDDEFITEQRQADPVPGTLVINAFPAWANIPFELDGKFYYSNSNGRVSIPVARWSTDLRSRIKVHESNRDDGSLATFTGWKQWFSVHSTTVYAAFQLSEPVTFSFVDEAGAPVESSIIDSVTIKSDSGVIKQFHGADLAHPVLITTASAAQGPSGIEGRPTQYVVDEVMIGGSNVVHRAQQKISFETSRHWTISLLFYGVTFTTRDAFFGSSVGKEIVIQSVDGSEQRIALNDQGQAYIPRLPRGEYTVAVLGGGYSPPRPIHVSRDQSIEMKVITPVDFASVLLVVGTAVIGLLVAGRPFLVTRPVRVAWHGFRMARLYAARGLRL